VEIVDIFTFSDRDWFAAMGRTNTSFFTSSICPTDNQIDLGESWSNLEHWVYNWAGM